MPPPRGIHYKQNICAVHWTSGDDVAHSFNCTPAISPLPRVEGLFLADTLVIIEDWLFYELLVYIW